MDFTNELINGIHISRYIASWINAGGVLKTRPEFRKDMRIDRYPTFRRWLGQLVINGRKLTDEEIRHIVNFATCGKLELESNAKNFIG